jgi:hypothetical protein
MAMKGPNGNVMRGSNVVGASLGAADREGCKDTVGLCEGCRLREGACDGSTLTDGSGDSVGELDGSSETVFKKRSVNE